MTKTHDYSSRVIWTGNSGQGTQTYRGYNRTWDIAVAGKPVVQCSNDPILGGDPSKMNPEDLLLSSLSACHMLWYLHLCSQNGIVVEHYQDEPVGVGETAPNGAGRFISAELRPDITISAGDVTKAEALHHEVHQYCFIARSVNFPVTYAPVVRVKN